MSQVVYLNPMFKAFSVGASVNNYKYLACLFVSKYLTHENVKFLCEKSEIFN